MAGQDAHFAKDISQLSLGHGGEPGNPPPPPTSATQNGLVILDIKDQFMQAVGTLEPGQIVKDAFFSLFESVAALEIMDPKMDSGCVAPGEEFDELYDVTRPLSPEEVLGIIDQLICHEMSWHQGYPLAQTILTSVYCEALLMPNPVNITEATFVKSTPADGEPDIMLQVLRAYCLGMLKTCLFVNERIKSEHYYEEEDFVTNTYNRTLLKDVARTDILETIDEAKKALDAARSLTAEAVIDGLLARLRLREAFMEAAWCDLDTSPADTSKEPWEYALRQLSQIKSTHVAAEPVPEAFSVKLQRKLASTMPPRAIVKIELDEAFAHLERLFVTGLEAMEVLKYSDPQSLQTFVSTFQAKKPQPPVFVRTVLQYFLFNDMQILGSHSIRQIMDDDFAILAMPASALLDRANDEIEAVQDPRFAVAQQMELFRQRAAHPYLDVLRTFCQNRCRVRRTLCHVVKAWDSLQVDANELDHIIQTRIAEHTARHPQSPSVFARPVDTFPQPLTSWTSVNKLRLMELIVQMGFELEVYQSDELAGMYWYLRYLAKCRFEELGETKSYIELTAEEVLSEENMPADLVADKQLNWALCYNRLAMVEALSTWKLADALSILYLVLLRTNALKTWERPYSNDELRYELRMKPFSTIGIPPLPTFQEFNHGVNRPRATSIDLLAAAEDSLGKAKSGFELLTKLDPEESFSVGSHDRWLASAKAALKACIATGIVLSSIRKALGEAQDGGKLNIKAEIPTPDKLYHEWWIVPKILPAS